MQRCGIEETSKAIDSENVSLVLVLRGSANHEASILCARAKSKGIKVKEISRNDMWRMSKCNQGEESPEILALVGRDPDATVEEILSEGGLIWLLSGAKYPVNIGFTIRTAEVSGANAVFVDGDLSHKEKKAALRASMKSNRFIPVHWTNSFDLVSLARESGFRIISIEDSGKTNPWDSNLVGDILLVVGGEKHGIPSKILDSSDSIIRIPMSGFVPSYNLQAPMAIVAAEAMRQNL